MNYYSIKQAINSFKLNQNFEEKDYLQILDDLDELYNREKSSYIQLTDNEYILKEKENFKKYLIGSLLNKANNESKSKNYELTLKYIKKLEFLHPSEKEIINKIDKIKQFCEINLNWIEGQNLLKNKNHINAIKFFKHLKETSINVEQYDVYSKGLELAKAEYLSFFYYEIIELLPIKKDKNSIEKCEKIINKCETIFKQFQYENKFKSKISEIKIKCFKVALEKIIEEKIECNIGINDEIIKYEELIKSENIKESKLEVFKLKITNSKNLNNRINNKNIVSYKNYEIIPNNEFSEIPLEIINNYLKIINNINEVEITKSLEEDIKAQIINYNSELKKTKDDIKEWITTNKDKIKDNKFRGNIFALFNKVNKKITGFDIRPIQLISLLILTKNEPKLGGIFLQINTGEGKSLIIQFLSAYLALLGYNVDVISSSSILADRDAEDKNIIEFYSNLGLTSGSASKDQYKENIVYGDTQNFEAAILREEFKEKQIRNNRSFDCVIIDEVDSISLDNIITMTQLTDSFPGRSCFYFFYYQILICYCQIINELPKLTGNSKEYFSNHPEEFEDIIHKQIKNMFKGKILENDIKHLKSNTPIVFPKCMKNYIEDSLDIWISNVIRAPKMIENRDFVIKKNIIPVDYSNTGVLQNNMVWEGGLQQILQIIHNTKGTFENENTNFLSNISFFKRYKGNIFGVTGTFGGSNFQFILKKVYGINLFKIPPNKPSLLEDWGSFVFTDEKEYIKNILNNIKTVIIEQKRSILLICNSIGKGEEFYKILEKDFKENVMKYFTEDDKETMQILKAQKA